MNSGVMFFAKVFSQTPLSRTTNSEIVEGI